MLARRLSQEYQVFFISFEGLGDAVYIDERAFCRRVCGLLYDTIYYGETGSVTEKIQETCCHMSQKDAEVDLRILSNFFSHICMESDRPVVLIIDEVDQASGQEIFLSFLGMLRDKYMRRRSRPTFRSVILAGVYDIKNLKVKIRKGEEPQYNSPWNIAEKFTVAMSFSQDDIGKMLEEYSDDLNLEMDTGYMAQMIYDYTGGYPFLVSRICQLVDESESGHGASWTKEGILKAVKTILEEKNTLFDDMGKKLTDVPGLDQMLRSILFDGKRISYSPDDYATELGMMFGYLKNEKGIVMVSNRIFETRLYNRYLSESVKKSAIADVASMGKNQFVADGVLNMDLVMEKFMVHFTRIYGDSDTKFLEENGRRIFLTYLQPIINGTGNYYIEARTRDMRRTDVVVDYHGRQYVIELKIWHDNEYNHRGELQLAGYLDDYGLSQGYLVSFNFNKNKRTGLKEIQRKGKRILEVVV